MSVMITGSDDSDSDLEVLMGLSDWDGSSDDEDDMPLIILPQANQAPSPEPPKRVRKKPLPNRTNFLRSLDDLDFTFRFRLDKSTVEVLLAEIMPFVKVTSKRNNGVAPIHQLLLTLRFYALGSMLKSIAQFVGVSKATASRTIREMSNAITSLYNKYVIMHLNGAENFFRIAQFPLVLGAIDCIHVGLKSPAKAVTEELKNRKGYLTVKAQAVCDADLRLMNVDACWPGSADNATIFDNSQLKAQCETGMYGNRWLLGDYAYPNRTYLLTPLLAPQSQSELRYNNALHQTRTTIQRTFELWRRRFPVLAMKMRLTLPTTQSVIVATAILHNVCRARGVVDVTPELPLPAPDPDLDRPQAPQPQDASDRAELISRYFF